MKDMVFLASVSRDLMMVFNFLLAKKAHNFIRVIHISFFAVFIKCAFSFLLLINLAKDKKSLSSEEAATIHDCVDIDPSESQVDGNIPVSASRLRIQHPAGTKTA